MHTNNDLMMLSDIIYKINTIEDVDEMRASVLKSLNLMIPSLALTFYLATPDHELDLANPIGVGLPEGRLEAYKDEIWDMDYTRWVFSAPSGKAYRESDFMDDEERIQTPYYKTAYEPVGAHYSAILAIIKDGTLYGSICLYRSLKQNDFTDDEMMVLNLLHDHLGCRLQKELQPLMNNNRSLPNDNELADRYNLTRREIEITRYLIRGEERALICDELSISPNTLKKHTINIYRKLEVNSWRELYRLFGSN